MDVNTLILKYLSYHKAENWELPNSIKIVTFGFCSPPEGGENTYVFAEEHCLSSLLLLQNRQVHSNLSSDSEWILISVSMFLPDKYLGNNLCDYI